MIMVTTLSTRTVARGAPRIARLRPAASWLVLSERQESLQHIAKLYFNVRLQHQESLHHIADMYFNVETKVRNALQSSSPSALRPTSLRAPRPHRVPLAGAERPGSR